MEDLLVFFYEIATELEIQFKVMWVRVHRLNSITLSGFGLIRRKDTNIFVQDFINLRFSYNPTTQKKNYIIDCSNTQIYYDICQIYKFIEYKPYELYIEMFKDLIYSNDDKYEKNKM